MAPIFCDRCGDTVPDECDPLDELAQLDALLERLALKRYDLKRKINRYHSPIIRQLPPDVMSTIFEFRLPDFADFQPFRPPSKADLCVPLSLGTICSYWREIAWSMPRLWSSLSVRVIPSKLDSHAAIVRDWLARSGQLPLSIRVLSNFYEPVLEGPVSAMADVINQYSTRWSDFDLCVPQSFYQFFHAADNHAPILKSIRFYRRPYSHADVGKLQLTCPQLERANLSSCRMDGLNIQWDNLTHLNLCDISSIDTFRILRQTPRLVFCDISDMTFPGVERPIIAPILIPRLRTLLIKSYFNEILKNLITPHLEELSLSKYRHMSVADIAFFIERSACSLRSFTMIFNFSAYVEDFTNFLSSLPSLKILSILTSGFYDPDEPQRDPRNILELVAKVISSSQQGFLPNLEVLKYAGKLQSGNDTDLFPLPPADNVVCGSLHLLKFDLDPITCIPKNLISYFSSLAGRGIRVNVLFRSYDGLQSSVEYYRDKEAHC